MHRNATTTRKLSRKRDQRRALIKSLVTSLIMHERITTTRPKAKTLQPEFEQLITKAKKGTLHARRQLAAVVSTPEAVAKLCNDIAPRFKDRNGGYTRVVPAGYRQGDNAELATISLVEESSPATSAQKPADEKEGK